MNAFVAWKLAVIFLSLALCSAFISPSAFSWNDKSKLKWPRITTTTVNYQVPLPPIQNRDYSSAVVAEEQEKETIFTSYSSLSEDRLARHRHSDCYIRKLKEEDLVPLVLMATKEFGSDVTWENQLIACTIYWGFRFRLRVSDFVDDHQVYVAVHEKSGDLIACCELSLNPANGKAAPAVPSIKLIKQILGAPAPVKPYISNLLVCPKYRRKGLARFMVEFCERKALKNWKEDSVYLHVDLDYEPALKLYNSLGYRRLLDDPKWIAVLNGGVRLRWMTKQLLDPSSSSPLI